MQSPSQRRALPYPIPDVEPGAALDQQTHDGFVACQDRLMKRCRMLMCSLRVEAIWILAGIEQYTDCLKVTVLRSERESAMTLNRARRGK